MKRKHINGKIWLIVACCAFFFLLYWVVRDDWKESPVVTDSVNQDYVLELTDGAIVEQSFVNQTDVLKSIQLAVNRASGSSAEGTLNYILRDADEVLQEGACPVQEITQTGLIAFAAPVEGRRGDRLTLQIQSDASVALWYGTTRSAGRINVALNTNEDALSINHESVNGELVMSQIGVETHDYMRFYWPIAVVLLMALIFVCVYTEITRRNGRLCGLNRIYDLLVRYRFLLKTLVKRDFNVKYKASILGVMWSFLNPLLMTVVYSFVFSTIFKSSIDHFVIYLMTGIILFNYFSDSTNLGMQSIVGNAGLITKVYIPKAIFPISKALSSSINLFISLLPLFIIMLFDGVGFHKSMLLIPVVLFFLILFCIGVSLLLSCMIVFFRDVQFLWSVFITVWNFITPVFYPESIIPQQFLGLYRLNPMYQYLYFMRCITIQGVSPGPATYLICLAASLGVFLVGLAAFRKNQHKFVLYL